MPPVLPPGKEGFDLVCARVFCQRRLSSVCISLGSKLAGELRKPSSLLLEYCCLPGQQNPAGLGPLLGQSLSRQAVAPISCSSGSPLCSRVSVCVQHNPSPACPGGCKVLPSPRCAGRDPKRYSSAGRSV